MNYKLLGRLHADFMSWELVPYIQKQNGTFIIDKSFVVLDPSIIVSPNSQKLIYTDYDGDGIKDIGFISENDMNQLKNKFVFIRKGNQFIAQPFFQFDPYAKSLLK
jgi:hypothetical protein